MIIGSGFQDAGNLEVKDGFFCSICDSRLGGVWRVWDLMDFKALYALRIGISWGVNAVSAWSVHFISLNLKQYFRHQILLSKMYVVCRIFPRTTYRCRALATLDWTFHSLTMKRSGKYEIVSIKAMYIYPLGIYITWYWVTLTSRNCILHYDSLISLYWMEYLIKGPPLPSI